MPDIPEWAPMMEGFEFNFEFPEMPEIPQIDIERFFLHDPNIGFNEENGQFFSLMDPGHVQIICDSAKDGNLKIIVINGGDSSVICTPHYYGSGMSPEQLEHFKMDKDMMKAYTEEWRAQADQWREQQQQMREQFRAQAEQQRAEQQYLRDKERNQYRWTEEQGRAIERELSQLDELKDIYVMGRPRLSLSDEMVKDGLVKPGAEVEVQLTPDKLKINGEKMPESIHQKYLELYELQQGVELSGNSRVEFTTKSKQRM
jgi:hypothetical protein